MWAENLRRKRAVGGAYILVCEEVGGEMVFGYVGRREELFLEVDEYGRDL